MTGECRHTHACLVQPASHWCLAKALVLTTLVKRMYACAIRWKATAIGANHQSAENILKQDYKDDITLTNAVKLVIKVPLLTWRR